MKEALRTSGLVARIEQGAVNALLGLPIVFSLSLDPAFTGGIIALLVLFGLAGVGPFQIALGIGVGTAAVGVFIAINEIFVPQYEFNGTAIALVVMACIVGFITILKRYVRGYSIRIPVIGAAVFSALFIGVFWQWNFYDSASYLSVLAQTSSSYSQTLAALAQSISQGTIYLVPESSGSSGPLLGIVLVVGRVLISWMDQNSSVLKIDNITTLAHLLIAVVAFMAALWFCIGATLFGRLNHLSRSIVGILFAFSTVVISLGILHTGRIDILLSYLFISFAAWMYAIGVSIEKSAAFAPVIITSLFLFASGLSWLPSLGFGVALFIGITGVRVNNRIKETQKTSRSENVVIALYVFATAGMITVVLLSTAFWELTTSSSNEAGKDSMPGGVSAINPYVVLAIFSLAIWFMTRVKTEVGQTKDILFFGAVVGLPTVVLVMSYFFSPYMPESGAWFLIFIACAALTPLVAAQIFLFLQTESKKLLAWVSVPILGVLLFLTLAPQISNLKTLGSTIERQSAWSERIIAEYKKTPARPIVCLNTREDDISGDAEAQLCTEMALRLGGFVTDTYEYWGEATGCKSGSINSQPIFPRTMLANMTIILSDPHRTSSLAGCQASGSNGNNGWLTDVDWTLIRKIDIDGVEVFPQISRAMP